LVIPVWALFRHTGVGLGVGVAVEQGVGGKSLEVVVGRLWETIRFFLAG